MPSRPPSTTPISRGDDADDERRAGAVEALGEHVGAERVGAEPGDPARSEGVLVGDLAVDAHPLVEAAHEPQAVAEHGEQREHGEEADAEQRTERTGGSLHRSSLARRTRGSMTP